MNVKETEPMKELVIDIDRFFRIKIPMDADPYDYIDTEKCRKICANSLLSQRTSLMLEYIEEPENLNIWRE